MMAADEAKRASSLIRPTTETLWHIDFDWWSETDSNWRVFLFDFLCGKHQKDFQGKDDSVKVDAVHPETAEVKSVDGFLFTLMNHCAKQPDFISDAMPLVARIFRIFLANGNQPLSSEQLAEIARRPARTILATLAGPQVYKGIRQYQR